MPGIRPDRRRLFVPDDAFSDAASLPDEVESLRAQNAILIAPSADESCRCLPPARRPEALANLSPAPSRRASAVAIRRLHDMDGGRVRGHRPFWFALRHPVAPLRAERHPCRASLVLAPEFLGKAGFTYIRDASGQAADHPRPGSAAATARKKSLAPAHSPGTSDGMMRMTHKES